MRFRFEWLFSFLLVAIIIWIKKRERERELKLCLIDTVLMEINGSLLTMYLTIKFAIIRELNENRCSILSTIKIRIAKRIRTVWNALFLCILFAVFIRCARHADRGSEAYDKYTLHKTESQRKQESVHGRNEMKWNKYALQIFLSLLACLLACQLTLRPHTFHIVEIQMKILEHSRAKT